MPEGSSTPLREVAHLCQELESTTKRGVKTTRLAGFLRTLSPREIPVAVSLLTGRLMITAGSPLEIGSATLLRARGPWEQITLTPSLLTLEKVAAILHQMAEAEGVRAHARREKLLQSLLGQASTLERKYLTRSILGDMRIGVVEGVMEEAIAQASQTPLHLVKRAYALTGDLGQVARKALTGGAEALKTIRLTLFHPFKPMLAEASNDLEEALRVHGGETALEYKYDGARVQVHLSRERVKVYSRRLTDLTESLPEVVDEVRGGIRCREAILDGEAVATGRNGRPLPFQEVMRRLRRVHHVKEEAERIPLRLYLFDILLWEGRTLIDTPYLERRRLLEEACPRGMLAENLVVSEVGEAENYLGKALKEGHEGVVAKALGGRYDPGARKKTWFKVKPFESLDVVIVAAEWGHGRRRGWLSNYHLAVKDVRGGFAVIGKTFKGLTDGEFRELTGKLLELKVGEEGGVVWVRPTLVMEVAYNELQRSPTYPSGYALRFARVQRIRWDKTAEEADSLEKVKALFERQFRYKGRLGGDVESP